MDWCLIASSSGMRHYARPRASRDDAGLPLSAAHIHTNAETACDLFMDVASRKDIAPRMKGGVRLVQGA